MNTINKTFPISDGDSVYSFVFSFEENFSPNRARRWMSYHYTNGFFFCGIYLFLIFSFQFYMHNKSRYELRRTLTSWYAGLALFSALGALRSIPELYHVLTDHSLYHSICYPTFLEPIKVIEFWYWLFILSKLVELGDTIFIVLRKQPVIFFHCFHHVTVLLYSWKMYPKDAGYARWFKTINYTIHSFMYSYYTLRTAGFSAPKFITMSISFLQIAQMASGCTIILLAYYYKLNDQSCQVSNTDMVMGGSMYFSYLVLFSKLFYEARISKSKRKYSYTPDNARVKRK